ncbi:MAG: HNH endonuclease signature motif containing protein [Phycisphaerae bacterium]|nr:HNH endonuclease signature motif containing protein [Phycisphaerae bacterium]
MSSQSAIDFLTFTISGRTVKVDPDIYYQIFNIRPTRPRRKYVGDIIGLRLSGENYPILHIGKNPTRLVPVSRFIMNPPPDSVVDHINGDRLDNRRENLRITNHRQNGLNRKPRNNTGFAGVSIYTIKGKNFCRGRFYNRDGKTLLFCAIDCPEHRILAAYAHDKFVLLANDEEYAPLNFEIFKYEPFRSFLLETDLNKYKFKMSPQSFTTQQSPECK